MEDTSKENIKSLIESQRLYFDTHQTKNIPFRRGMLKRLKNVILKYEASIIEALWIDLHKSEEEAFLTEISIVLNEIDFHLKNLKCWTKPKRVLTPLVLLPSSSRIVYEPLGMALIVAPWNYPFQLLMNPLVGAISSGCCAVLKPSPYTPTIAKLMEKMIKETFNSEYIGITQGGRNVNGALLKERFDFIFYTGSPDVGKVAMRAAAEYLTPIVLELGGKSPCIVDKDANIKIAAKRIAWGKTINAGQTCIAPDYLFVHRSVKEELLTEMAAHFFRMYGKDIRQSKYFPRIVNQAAVERLKKLMLHGKIVFGGEVDEAEKFISPTIIDEVRTDFPIMQEEIFGPILPVLTFDDISEATDYIQSHEKPLALYYFGRNKGAKEILLKTTSGGSCINDTLMHIVNNRLPFGGVGNSGFGKYHGHNSFIAFSNSRAIVDSPTWIDIYLKYPPYKHFKWLKKII